MGKLEYCLPNMSPDKEELTDMEPKKYLRKLSGNRSHSNMLLEFSEELDHLELSDRVKTVTKENSNDLCAWVNVVPFAKYLVQRKTKSNKIKDDNFITNNLYDKYTNNDWPVKGKYILDLDYLDLPLWKACVEPVTYRYVPNNGRYRSCKCQKKTGFAITADQKHKNHSFEKLSTRQKVLQREIKRELRKGFDNASKKDDSLHGPTVNDREIDKNNRKQTDAGNTDSAESMRGKLRRQESFRKENTSQNNEEYPERNKEEIKISPIPLPPISVPLVHSIASKDSFVEQFSSRLSALDHQVKHGIKSLGSPRDGPGVGFHFRSKSEPLVSTQVLSNLESINEYLPLPVKDEIPKTDGQKKYKKPLGQVAHIKHPDTNMALTHIKYTTASGNTINFPKFGTSSIPPAPEFYKTPPEPEFTSKTTKPTIKYTPLKNKPTASISVEDTPDMLSGVITTLQIASASNDKQKQSSNVQAHTSKQSRNQESSRTVEAATNRESLERSPGASSPLLLPQISGKGISVTYQN